MLFIPITLYLLICISVIYKICDIHNIYQNQILRVISLASFISVILSEGIDGCQRNVLGNFLMSISQNILTFDAQSDCLNQKNLSPPGFNS
jgi:hypothetical protein